MYTVIRHTPTGAIVRLETKYFEPLNMLIILTTGDVEDIEVLRVPETFFHKTMRELARERGDTVLEGTTLPNEEVLPGININLN